MTSRGATQRVVVRVAHRWLSDASSSSAPANVKRLAGYVVGAAKRRDLAQPEFAQALRVFADGAKHGAPVRDYATASMLVRACCTSGGAGAYVARELPTAPLPRSPEPVEAHVLGLPHAPSGCVLTGGCIPGGARHIRQWRYRRVEGQHPKSSEAVAARADQEHCSEWEKLPGVQRA